jgi:hypothetical protein
MPFINSRVFDLGLNILDTEANRLDICSAEPTTYSQATSSLTLGNKTSLSVGAPADRTPSGREVLVTAFTDGAVTTSGTAIAWAISDTINSRLLATGALTSVAVVSGSSFSIGTGVARVGIPGA